MDPQLKKPTDPREMLNMWLTPFLVVFVSTGGLINKEAAHSQQSLNMALDKRLAGVVRGTKLKKKILQLIEQK